AHEFDQCRVGSWSNTRFLELREDGRLLAVAATDIDGRAVPAGSTCCDPYQAPRGLGTPAILRRVEWARRGGRRHLYLGYWIAGHGKMDYKRRFRPLEGFDGRRWRPFEEIAPA